MDYDDAIRRLKSKANRANAEGMARFGINPKGALGVPIPLLRKMAKEAGKDHALALRLWDSDIHEGRILACLIDDPAKVSEEQMESWVLGFDSWDVCDQCCSNLFDKTPYAKKKAVEWSRRGEEWVKRAGYVLMAALSVHDKRSDDALFERFLPLIREGSTDERNFVKKAVNWALRQIGKRNRRLNGLALKTAKDIAKMDSKAARWIAADAVRELESGNVRRRLR